MEVVICRDPEDASRRGANLIGKLVQRKPNAVIGLATGSTPLALYRELIRLHREHGLDFSGVTTFNLDEYVGLPPTHECSYRRFMDENLFDHLNIKPGNTHVPNGMATDIPAECAAYEEAIQAAGGLDLQLLGIGSDGHIGFNEPTSSLVSRTRIKTITEQTARDNARFFEDDISRVPKHCITMGIGTIMEAREVVLLAFGANKAAAVRESIEGPVAAMMPASILQMHAKVKFLVDEAAAVELQHQEYYRWVHANKPAWQEAEFSAP